MNWADGLGDSLNYIESNLANELSVSDIAKTAYVSPFYFQKAFSMLCGYTVGEYVRFRRLSCAGSELAGGESRVIDVALKYGYDSPDSFSKAFTRFHGVTPLAVKRGESPPRYFAPLKIKLILEGGTIMECKIMKKDSFTVIGCKRTFKDETSKADIPAFWGEYYSTGKCKAVCGVYGICVSKQDSGDEFDYYIADDYDPKKEIPEGFTTLVIPSLTWAVFPCRGAMPDALQQLTRRIFNEWLPNNGRYKIDAGYDFEYYSAPSDYEGGNQNPNYYSEVWIPVTEA